MRITSLDALIDELKRIRSERGSDCEVGIDDADTNWHLKIISIEFSRRFPDRLLIGGDFTEELEGRGP